MAATVQSTVAITSTSQSVTVPVACKAAVFSWTYFSSTTGAGLASATLASTAADVTAELPVSTDGSTNYLVGTGFSVFYDPPSGSQTFAHSLDAAADEGPTRWLTFITGDGDIAVRGTPQFDHGNSTAAVTVTLTGLTAGDLALGHDQKFGGTAPGNSSGWTSLATQTSNSESARLRSIVAAGTSQVVNGENEDYSSIAAIAFSDTAGLGPAITDVDTDETVLDGQTSVAVTGTDMGADETERTFTLRQGSTSVPQTETGSGTATAAALTIGIEQSGADIKFGAATLRCTRTSDSAFGDLAITVNPPTGQLYVDIVTPDTTAANRITAVADIATGDQLQARGEGGGSAPAGLTLDSAARFWFSGAAASFDVRVWDASDATWGAWATQSLGFPAGRADETDTALSLARSKAKAAGVATETDAAQALSGAHIRATGSTTETDSALALDGVKSRSAGLATETDTAFALTEADGGLTAPVGRADETDSALGLAGQKSRATGTAEETDSAQALSGMHARSAGLASELETALACSAIKVRSVGLGEETDSALQLALAGTVSLPTGTAEETDTAYSLVAVQRRQQATGGFWPAFEREHMRRSKRRQEEREAEEEAERIADETTREIAQLLRRQEVQDARRAELDRLSALVGQYADRQAEIAVSPRVEKALARAMAGEGTWAIVALDRELRRALEEERFFMEAALLILND